MTKKRIDWISDMAGFEVYEELELKDRMSFKAGQVYYAPVKYPLTPPKVLQPESYNPEKDLNAYQELVSEKFGWTN